MPEVKTAQYEFGPFRLDPGDRRLLHEGRSVPLRAKVFDTLQFLVESQGRLVSKDDLMAAVWPDSAVEENNLAHNISVLRKTLGEQATGQKYIETVPGQSYRFVAEVRPVFTRAPVTGRGWQTRTLPAAKLVHREAEVGALRDAFARALSGMRQIVFVTGEAGIGKSTLVAACMEEIRETAPAWHAQGQCLEHRTEGEPYMPLLEALSRMCREPGGEDVIPLLIRCAPTWMRQIPWLLSDQQLAEVRDATLGVTRERMLREIAEAVDLLSAGKPLVLVLEDLHWSDDSTVGFLDWLARRQGPSRLLVIGTFRPADLRGRTHPVQTMAGELRVRGLCRELPLAFLGEAAIQEYLAARFDDTSVAMELAPMVHRRTEGNPLFMVNVVDHWVSQHLLGERLSQEALARSVPATLRQLIEQQLMALEPEDRKILEAASVSGRIFAVAAVAAAIDRSDEEVEERCTTLARNSHFVQALEAMEWPDGSITAQFAYIHDLHHEVLYDRIPPARKARLHERTGRRLESGYAGSALDAAAELATHFVRGRNPERAGIYLRHAAEQVFARSAHPAAIGHLQTGLQMLSLSPDFPGRAMQEATLYNLLARALIATKGWGAEEPLAAYRRAREICLSLGDPPELTPSVQLGLATLLEVRGQYRESQETVEEYLRGISNDPNSKPMIESFELLACSLFHQGVFNKALDHAQHGLKLYDPKEQYTLLASCGNDPGVSCHSWAALNLWFLGYPDRAVEEARRAIDVAYQHAYSLAMAQTRTATLHQCRREPLQVRHWAGEALRVSRERGFSHYDSLAAIFLGWAMAVTGEHETGLDHIRRGLRECRAAGEELDVPHYFALLAEALACSGRVDEAMETLDEALESAGAKRAFFYEPELHRLRGEVLHRAGRPDAEQNFQRALDSARTQGARCLELRAALSLAQLWASQGRTEEARELLAPVYDWFTEGLELPDAQEARRLLGR